MYLEHFGLREPPFRITPHTEFFFAGANRGATLEALIYAITHDEGIVKVSGEVGSGKTMLCRMLLEKLPENIDTVYLANPSLSRAEILHAIADELQVALPEGRPHRLLRVLQERLIDIYASGRRVVIMIDEAHAMPPETLEEIRLLSNLESSLHKLLHIVLFGQPELDERLSETSMRQLKERITHNFALEPLHRSDTSNYLMFRIRAAGYRGPDLFTPGAIQLISNASEGLTRRINILADKAMLSAFSENKHLIDSKQVRAAIRDAQFNPMHDNKFSPRYWVTGSVVVMVIAILAFIAGSYRAPKEVMPIAKAPAETTSGAPTSTPTMTPPPDTAKTASPAHLPAPAAPDPAPASIQPEKAPTLADRVAATEDWLKKTPDTHFFIQLLSTDSNNAHTIESFLTSNPLGLDPQKIRVYRSKLSGRERYGVIYGDYPSLEAASADLAQLAKKNPTSGPYIRSVTKLR